MIKKILILAISLGFVVSCTKKNATSNNESETLKKVQSRGILRCGVSQGLPGFSNVDDQGNWTGLDVEYCRAIAAAIFGDPNKVEFKPLSAKIRFTTLTSGEIDVLARNTTWSFDRDTSLGVNFVGVNYYDGQGFMVRKALGTKSALDLEGASVCTNTGTTTELNVTDFFRTNNLKFNLVSFENSSESVAAYDKGRCDVYTTDRSGLAAQRTRLAKPDDHEVLSEIISKEPLGPVVRQGDDGWANIARWVLNATITAEELGLTSQNVDAMKNSSTVPEVQRLLGKSGNLAANLSLNPDWAYNIIKLVGNYGESYERNISPLGLSRGVNALWTQGGILYSPPVR